jgi:hypothetical protein
MGGPGRGYSNNPDYEQALTAAQEGKRLLSDLLAFFCIQNWTNNREI